jgi:hypothetical protein
LQSPQADAQHLGGELPIAGYVFERKFDVSLFQFLESLAGL